MALLPAVANCPLPASMVCRRCHLRSPADRPLAATRFGCRWCVGAASMPALLPVATLAVG
jgi:hypothetical protein